MLEFGRLLRISWALGPIDVLTEMRTKHGRIKKINLEYLEADQLQKEYSMDWSQCLFSEDLKIDLA